MTLDDLRAFVAACDAGSLSAAARDSGRSQAAVSQHIRRLEHELGVRLFERSRRGVLPTAAGRKLLAAARSSLATIDTATRDLQRLARGEGGILRVATGGTTLRHFMTKPLAQFQRRHPEVRFEYVSASSTRDCLDALRQDRADLAYITISADETVQQRPTVRTEWVLITKSDDPVSDRPEISVADLARIHAIAMASSTTSRSQLEQQLAGHGVQLNYAATVDEWDTAIQLVELGVGHAIVPAMWVHDLARHRQLRSRPIPALTPVTFGWGARNWDDLPDYATAFADTVNAGIANLSANARIQVID